MTQSFKELVANPINVATQDHVVVFEGLQKYEFTIDNISAWQSQMNAGKGKYQPLLSSARFDDLYAKMNAFVNNLTTTFIMIPLVIGIAMITFGYMAVGLITLGTADPNLTANILVAISVAALIGGIVLRKVKGGDKYADYVHGLSESVRDINRAGLKDWMKARYDIDVDNDTIMVLEKNVMITKQDIRFTDTQNRSWKFTRETNGAEEFWVVES
jgi:uncharacterized membrane protein (DUF485 family)